MEELFIGLDIGTSMIKAVPSTAEGKIVARACVNYPTISQNRAGQSKIRWIGGKARLG